MFKVVLLLAFLAVFMIKNAQCECKVKEYGIPMIYPEGLEWKSDCDTCKCINSQVICSGGRKCDIPHSDSLAWTCLKWSEDKCCCLSQGCVGHDDKEYAFGQLMPMSASGCEKCECTEHALTAPCFVENTDECSRENHDHPFVSDHLHHHQNGGK